MGDVYGSYLPAVDHLHTHFDPTNIDLLIDNNDNYDTKKQVLTNCKIFSAYDDLIKYYHSNDDSNYNFSSNVSKNVKDFSLISVFKLSKKTGNNFISISDLIISLSDNDLFVSNQDEIIEFDIEKINIDQWHQMSLVREKYIYKLYIDGEHFTNFYIKNRFNYFDYVKFHSSHELKMGLLLLYFNHALEKNDIYRHFVSIRRRFGMQKWE